MDTIIISAFPGMGKTTYYNQNKDICLDSDSSNFSWIKDSEGNNTKERNPEFPKNYIEHIKENMGKYDYIFISSHIEVRKALIEAEIPYFLFYPEKDRKEELIQIYKDRGNNEAFVKLLESNFENWIEAIENEKENLYTNKLPLSKKQFIGTMLFRRKREGEINSDKRETSQNKITFEDEIKYPISDRPVRILYKNYKGKEKYRDIIPLKLFYGSNQWHPEPQYLLQAFDLDKKEVRDFALNNLCGENWIGWKKK